MTSCFTSFHACVRDVLSFNKWSSDAALLSVHTQTENVCDGRLNLSRLSLASKVTHFGHLVRKEVN